MPRWLPLCVISKAPQRPKQKAPSARWAVSLATNGQLFVKVTRCHLQRRLPAAPVATGGSVQTAMELSEYSCMTWCLRWLPLRCGHGVLGEPWFIDRPVPCSFAVEDWSRVLISFSIGWPDAIGPGQWTWYQRCAAAVFQPKKNLPVARLSDSPSGIGTRVAPNRSTCAVAHLLGCSPRINVKSKKEIQSQRCGHLAIRENERWESQSQASKLLGCLIPGQQKVTY